MRSWWRDHHNQRVGIRNDVTGSEPHGVGTAGNDTGSRCMLTVKIRQLSEKYYYYMYSLEWNVFLRNGKFYFYHYAFSKRGFGGYNGIGRMRLTSKFLHKVVTYIQVSSVFKLNLSKYLLFVTINLWDTCIKLAVCLLSLLF